MVTTAPTAVKAAFATTINGVAYTKDQTLTFAQVAGIKRLDAYLSKGVLYLVPDQHNRKATLHYRRPSHLGPRELYALSGNVGIAPHLVEGGGDGPMAMAMSAQPEQVGADSEVAGEPGPAEGGGGELKVLVESRDANRITVGVSGGATPYHYDWGDDSTAHVQRTHAYQNTGRYTITVTDDEGATGSVRVQIR